MKEVPEREVQHNQSSNINNDTRTQKHGSIKSLPTQNDRHLEEINQNMPSDR